MIDDFNLLDQWINSNANTDRGHYHNLLNPQDCIELYPNSQKDVQMIKSDSSKETKFKMISRNKIENLFERHFYDQERKKHALDRVPEEYISEKQQLEIQVESLIARSSLDEKEGHRNNKEFKFKNSDLNSVGEDDSPLLDEQKGEYVKDNNTKLRLSFDMKKCPPQPNTYSTPWVESSIMSNVDLSRSEVKNNKIELSEQAKILMDKLNIQPTDFYENFQRLQANLNMSNNDGEEEEKGEFTVEEFDQSRPMTTRIYDNEDDQQLNIQYKNAKASEQRKGELNKHISVEAGWEGKRSGESKLNESNSLGEEQYSVIVKNIEDLDGDSEFQFNSDLQTPMQADFKNDVIEEDMMTVIENDCDNEYENIFRSLKEAETKITIHPRFKFK